MSGPGRILFLTCLLLATPAGSYASRGGSGASRQATPPKAAISSRLPEKARNLLRVLPKAEIWLVVYLAANLLWKPAMTCTACLKKGGEKDLKLSTGNLAPAATNAKLALHFHYGSLLHKLLAGWVPVFATAYVDWTISMGLATAITGAAWLIWQAAKRLQQRPSRLPGLQDEKKRKVREAVTFLVGWLACFLLDLLVCKEDKKETYFPPHLGLMHMWVGKETTWAVLAKLLMCAGELTFGWAQIQLARRYLAGSPASKPPTVADRLYKSVRRLFARLTGG